MLQKKGKKNKIGTSFFFFFEIVIKNCDKKFVILKNVLFPQQILHGDPEEEVHGECLRRKSVTFPWKILEEAATFFFPVLLHEHNRICNSNLDLRLSENYCIHSNIYKANGRRYTGIHKLDGNRILGDTGINLDGFEFGRLVDVIFPKLLAAMDWKDRGKKTKSLTPSMDPDGLIVDITPPPTPSPQPADPEVLAVIPLHVRAKPKRKSFFLGIADPEEGRCWRKGRRRVDSISSTRQKKIGNESR